MDVLTQAKKNQSMDEFLSGISAESICRNYKITPIQLVELFHSTQQRFVNVIFDEPEESKVTLVQVKNENSKLKGQQQILDRKIKEYEIEIRVHKEVLEALLTNKANKLK